LTGARISQRREVLNLTHGPLSLRDESVSESDARVTVREALLAENRQRFPLTDGRLSVRDSLLGEMGPPFAWTDGRLSARDSLVSQRGSRLAATDGRLGVKDAPLHVRHGPVRLNGALGRQERCAGDLQ
jgi:hypothetical protein